MMSPYMLEVRNVSKVFRMGGLIFGTKFTAVDNVSIAFRRDSTEVISLAGESGSGKTTLARMILGILKPTRGNIFYEGKDIFKLRGKELKDFRRAIQPIFQNPYEAVCPFEKAETYLILTAQRYGLARTKEDAEEIINEVLDVVGLNFKYIQGKYPHEFSGGELQRIMIARALLAKPRLLVADEPLSLIHI